jgi:hypothetical protein
MSGVFGKRRDRALAVALKGPGKLPIFVLIVALSESPVIRPERRNTVQKPFRKPLRDVPVLEFKLGARANR